MALPPDAPKPADDLSERDWPNLSQVLTPRPGPEKSGSPPRPVVLPPLQLPKHLRKPPIATLAPPTPAPDPLQETIEPCLEFEPFDEPPPSDTPAEKAATPTDVLEYAEAEPT